MTPAQKRAHPVRPAAVVLAALSAFGCQVLFGSYDIDASAVPPPAVVCERGSARCAGPLLQTCSRDRLGWVTVETCESEALCNLSTESCEACDPGEYQCNENVLRRCAADRTWQLVDTCFTPQLCSVREDRREGACRMAVCNTPGEYRCMNERLRRCAPGRERWEEIEVCASAALCDSDLANLQASAGEPVTCRPPNCRAGEYFCEQGKLGRCATTTFETWDPIAQCDPAETCNPKAGNCSACTPGEFACSGGQLLRCDEAATWQQIEMCASVALCDAEEGRCEPPACDQPGQIRCDPGLQLLHCKADLSALEELDFCPTFGLCNAAARRCDPPACRSNSTRCAGDRYEQCLPDWTGWQTIEQCGLGEVCDPMQGCVPGPCTNGASRCNERYLEQCRDGVWRRLQRCATPELCDASASNCKPPVCGDETRFRCRNSILEVCATGRHQYEERQTCAADTECDAATGSCR